MSAPNPSLQCEALAELLANTARQELAPQLRGLLPDERKAVVRAYWLAQIADMGGIGTALAGTLKRAA